MQFRQRTADLAYAAGLFDGEGSVKTHRHCVRGKTYHYPRVAITNTQKVLLRFVCDTFGGYICKTGTPAKKTHKQVWRWEASCQIAVTFLTAVLPFMREPEKIRRAKLAVKLAAVPLAKKDNVLAAFIGAHRG